MEYLNSYLASISFDLFCAGSIERVGNLDSQRESCFGIQRFACNAVLQRQPVQKLHGDERVVRAGHQSRGWCRCSDDSVPRRPAPLVRSELELVHP